MYFVTAFRQLTLCLISVLLICSCSRYTSTLEDCPWEAHFPQKPAMDTLFNGKNIRKQRERVTIGERTFRATCTLWKKPTHKETDERWIKRIVRLLNLDILDRHTQHFADHTHVRLIANQGCPGSGCSHYWIDSYFDGQARYVLLYRQPKEKLDVKGREFLGSIQPKSR